MKKLFFIAFVFLNIVHAQAFDEIEGEDKSEIKQPQGIFDPVPEKPPRFPGGEDSLFAFISRNVDLSCINQCGGGRVWLAFTIDKTGQVKNVNIQRGYCLKCDEEAVRVISFMPVWEPGTMNGIPVEVGYRIPIKFGMK